MTATDTDAHTTPATATLNPALARLYALVGTWEADIPDADDPANPVHARTTFEWLEGRTFLIQRWESERPPFPSGIAIIGWDAASERFVQHYFDSRGVARTYQMTMENGTWTLWRAGDDQDFNQRFEGVFSADGNTIEGHWDTGAADGTWERDFDLTYTRTA